jgi:hypothetical protein
VSYFWTNAIISSVIDYRSPLRFSPPKPGLKMGEPITRRVVIVLVDGLRLDTSTNNAIMPYLNFLRIQAASATMHSHPPSYSEPGYATILTGAWPEINDGPAVNLNNSAIPIPTQDDLFTAVHRAGLRTAISAYYWFEKLIPASSVDASFFTPGEDATADEAVMNAALPMLSGDYQLILIHLDQVDYAGHFQGGPLSPNWDAAAKKVDGYLREIVTRLNLNKDTIIVVSDHGQIDRGGHGGPEPITLMEPFVMVGAGVQPGANPDIQQADIAPTVAALLGANIPASSQGLVQTAMLTLSSDYSAKILTEETAQKKILYQAYTTAIKSQPAEQQVLTNPLSYAIAMNAALKDKLSRERVWRTLVSIFLGILPVCILVIRGEKKALWLAVGAIIYVLLFNLWYSVLAGRTYSLSSVESETSLIRFIAIAATFSLIVSWTVAMVRLHAFEHSPLEAAETSMNFTFITLYLLALPILVHFAVNGVVVTWTLPEFYTIFIALLSLIQWRLLVAIGLLLIVAAALLARYVPHPARKYSRRRR